MSRKTLIVVAVVGLLLAAFTALALLTVHNADGAMPVLTGSRAEPSGHLSTWTVPIEPNGDCEGGGAGGCPIPG